MYLDNAATTPLLPEVKEYIISMLDNYGNPSSAHSVGDDARHLVNEARETIAKFINGYEGNIIFTSGGCASNTLAIQGFLGLHPDGKVFYSPTCHKSILKAVPKGAEKLKVDSEGVIDRDYLKEKLEEYSKKPWKLVVFEHANSEIGTIQDVAYLTRLAHRNNALVYVDCTGSISQIPMDVKDKDVDMMGFSGHKLGALKGIGVFYKKQGIELSPIIYGSQGNGLFGGTENTIGIASLKKAIECHKDYDSINYSVAGKVKKQLGAKLIGWYIVGAEKDRLPYNLHLCFKGVSGEALMTLLDIAGIQVSTGSACNSGDHQVSPTLKAIKMLPEDMNSCIRLSFSGNEKADDIAYLTETITESVNRLRSHGEGSERGVQKEKNRIQ